MTEVKPKVPAKNLLLQWFVAEDEVFSDSFIQLFVELNGNFNYRFFNEVCESSLSHTEINSGILELTGSKKIEYRDPNTSLAEGARVFKAFKKTYEYGKYANARHWIADIYDNTDVVLPRSLVLGWIAEQRPERSAKSFAPINDGNLYHASEKSLFETTKRSKPASGE